MISYFWKDRFCPDEIHECPPRLNISGRHRGHGKRRCHRRDSQLRKKYWEMAWRVYFASPSVWISKLYLSLANQYWSAEATGKGGVLGARKTSKKENTYGRWVRYKDKGKEKKSKLNDFWFLSKKDKDARQTCFVGGVERKEDGGWTHCVVMEENKV